MSPRPNVSVVVPFFGPDPELRRLQRRLAAIIRRQEDELIVIDNRAHSIRTPAHARNRGAAQAHGDWLLFIDADTVPAPDLLDAYFDPPPGRHVGVLAGAIRDVPGPRNTLIARHAVARGHMSQQVTLARKGRPYAQTANCMVRREAFQAVGGFEDRARAGEDADLCFRLMQAGWRIEERPGAAVEHETRDTIAGWLRQLVVHGSGAAWAERRWPGEFPGAGRELLGRLAHDLLQAFRAVVRLDLQEAGFALLDVLGGCAFELGRLVPNTRSGGCDGGWRGEGQDEEMDR